MPENREETLAATTQLIARFGGHGINRDNAAHFRGWLDRQLLIHRCDDCGRWQHPPRPMCPACWSWNIHPTEVSGRGTIHLLMTLRQGPLADGVDYRTGHPVITVELDEQPALRFTATVTNDYPAEALAIGAPVELDWVERDGTPTPVFRAAS